MPLLQGHSSQVLKLPRYAALHLPTALPTLLLHLLLAGTHRVSVYILHLHAERKSYGAEWVVHAGVAGCALLTGGKLSVLYR